jgi:hypothetical protein
MNATTKKISPYFTGCVLLAVLANMEVALGQADLRTVLVEEWQIHGPEYKALLLADGLNSRQAEERALALAGIARLSLEDRELSRARFAAEDIARSFDDGDAEVVRQAMRAYASLAADDSAAEAAIVARARRGGGPLQDWEYIRYLRPEGITSSQARDWLLELAEGPVAANKFSAAELLVFRLDEPPQSLLPEVMQLIRSDEYFCHPNLTQFVPKFGPGALSYLDELKELRASLSSRIGTAAGNRSAGGQTLGAFDMEMMDKAIGEFENIGAID